jgi:hypothetical protein
MLTNVQQDVHNNIKYYSNWGRLEMLFIKPPFEIAIVGPNFENARKAFDKNTFNAIFLGGKEGP